MRWMNWLWIVCLLVGCQTQAVPVANPFVGPSVVPPPATRTPAPGTAAPYYPGDTLPGTAPPVAPPAVAPQPSPYTSPPTYQPAPAAAPPATTPGGWGTYPPTSQTPLHGVQPVSANIEMGAADSVQVPTDNQSLRFAPVQPAAAEPTVPQTPVTQPVVPPTPEQGVAQVQFVNQPSPVDHRPVSIREISSRQADAHRGDDAVGADGFRPQGSSRSDDEDNRFSRPVEKAAESATASSVSPEVANRFGFDPQYSWLRGKLEQSPATGQWQLHYVPVQGTKDQFGGAISIANPQVLGNLQNGDYVAVQGQLQMLQIGNQTNVPQYAISVLQRQQQGVR